MLGFFLSFLKDNTDKTMPVKRVLFFVVVFSYWETQSMGQVTALGTCMQGNVAEVKTVFSFCF